MLRRIVCPALAVLVAAAMAAATVGSASGNEAPAGAHAGPPYKFTTELMGEYSEVSLKDSGMLTRTVHGYRWWTGQQNSHLVVTRVDRGLRFRDTGTKSIKKLSPACHRNKVRVGIAAVCRVPRGISQRLPLLVEVWPRLGKDFTDTSSLPATFAVTMLSDKGHDVARFGAGPDFFNGFSGRDRIWGGAGNDWIRGGLDNDRVQGGRGNDDLTTVEGRDTVRGGRGKDRLWTGDGDDRLWAGGGRDLVSCGNGRDNARVGAGDHFFQSCESVDRQ